MVQTLKKGKIKENYSEEEIKEINHRCVEIPTKRYLKSMLYECVLLPNLEAWSEEHGEQNKIS